MKRFAVKEAKKITGGGVQKGYERCDGGNPDETNGRLPNGFGVFAANDGKTETRIVAFVSRGNQ